MVGELRDFMRRDLLYGKQMKEIEGVFQSFE